MVPAAKRQRAGRIGRLDIRRRNGGNGAERCGFKNATTGRILASGVGVSHVSSFGGLRFLFSLSASCQHSLITGRGLVPLGLHAYLRRAVKNGTAVGARRGGGSIVMKALTVRLGR